MKIVRRLDLGCSHKLARSHAGQRHEGNELHSAGRVERQRVS